MLSQYSRGRDGVARHTCVRKNDYTVWVGILKERDHLEELGAGGKTILKWILRTKHRMALNILCHK